MELVFIEFPDGCDAKVSVVALRAIEIRFLAAVLAIERVNLIVSAGAGRVLPFRLRGQAAAGPSAVIVRLNPGHAHHGKVADPPTAIIRRRETRQSLLLPFLDPKSLERFHFHFVSPHPEILGNGDFVLRIFVIFALAIRWNTTHPECTVTNPHVLFAVLPVARYRNLDDLLDGLDVRGRRRRRDGFEETKIA